MKAFLTICASLFFVLTLPHCANSAASDCGIADDPQSECGVGTACAWMGSEQSACLALCEPLEGCAEDEFCWTRPLPTSGAELVSANVCFPRELVELPGTDAEFEVLGRECRARGLEDCGKNPNCIWEYASKVDLVAQCSEPMPVGCFAIATICTPSFFVAENSAGEFFVFAAGCGNNDFTGLNLDFDDPLFQVLFEGETTVYEWPNCG